MKSITKNLHNLPWRESWEQIVLLMCIQVATALQSLWQKFSSKFHAQRIIFFMVQNIGILYYMYKDN